MATATQEKQILIRTSGEEDPLDIPVTLVPDTLVTDVLEQADLLGYRLVSAKGSHFQPGENLYNQVVEGQKIIAVRVDDLSAGI